MVIGQNALEKASIVSKNGRGQSRPQNSIKLQMHMNGQAVAAGLVKIVYP